MNPLGIPLLVVGAVLMLTAGLLALLNSARSLVNLFVISGLRMIEGGFFTTQVGVEMVALLGGMLLFFGIVAVV
jgi:hypothetical protein